MGSASSVGNETPPQDSRTERESRPSLGPAIISGGCAVLVALITGLFNWINRPGPPASARTPTLVIEPRTPNNTLAPASELVRTVTTENATPRPPASQPLPQYGLNFAAFQAAIKDRDSDPEVRRKVVESVRGRTVIWQGYVHSVTEFKQHERGWVASVELVEDPAVLTQSMFRTSAYCRFETDPGRKVAKLQRGDLVTISGECERQGLDDIGTEVTSCHLVDAYYDDPRDKPGR